MKGGVSIGVCVCLGYVVNNPLDPDADSPSPPPDTEADTPPVEMATAGGTHPIGMHSCYLPQRSWGKVIFSQASVILLKGGGSTWPGRPPSPWADPPPPRSDPPPVRPPGTKYTPPRYGQRAGGTHPTGMQTCLANIFCWIHLIRQEVWNLLNIALYQSKEVEEVVPYCTISALLQVTRKHCSRKHTARFSSSVFHPWMQTPL